MTAGSPFDLALRGFVDPDAGWANPPRFSADALPPGITLTQDGRVQGQIATVGATVTFMATITDSLSGQSASASVFLRAEAEGGGLAPRVNTDWQFMPGPAQLGDITGPYRLVERRYIPGRAESAFGPALPARWESVDAPAWITVDPATGRLEGTPPTAGRIVLAYEVDLPGEGDSVNTLVLSSFTLNVREDLVVNSDGPAAGPPLGTTLATEGRYFRWVMPSANLAGATSIRLDRLQVAGLDGAWADEPAPSWLRWNESFRRLEGTPPTDGRYRLVFIGQVGDAPTEIALELEVREAQAASTGSISWPEPGLGDAAFDLPPLTLHGGLNLSAYTAMGNGPAQTLRAGVARSMPAPTPVPAPGSGKANLENLWFTYDGLNRVVIHQGALNNGTIELVETEYGSARQSHQNVYDTAGRLVAQSGLATRIDYSRAGDPQRVQALETRYFVHDLRGNVVAEGVASSLLGTPLVQLPYIEAQNRLYGMDDRTAYFAALRDLVPEATTLRRYDDLGRLVEEREFYGPGSLENAIADEAEPPPDSGILPKRIGDGDLARTKLDVSGWLRQSSSFAYDADGRMLTQSVFRRDETTRQQTIRLSGDGFTSYDTGVKDWVEAAYNEMQRNPDAAWQVERRYQLQPSTLTESTVTRFAAQAPTGARYDWRGRQVSAGTPALGYDGAGNLLGYTVQERSGGTVRWTDTYSYTYSLQDGYLETKVSGTSSDAKRRASETLSSYDGWGRRTSLEERTNLKDYKQTLRSARYFAYDAEGGLISRREGELVEEKNQPLQFRQSRKEEAGKPLPNPVPALITQDEWAAMSASQREYWAGAANTHRYSFANGQLLGSVSEAGRMSVGDRLTGFENSSLGTSTVVVRSGETLRSVAQRIYGDGSLWYVLADANGLTNSDETLAEGQNLQVPQVGTNTNSASTFRPYDPSEQIGPTAPSLPTIAPPPKNSCNPIAQLLMVIVAVVVTIYTAGAAASAMGAVGTTATGATASTFATGSAVLAGGAAGGVTVTGLGASALIGSAAIGGAVGSIASQAVGMATGQQQGFSWRGVAAGALSAGFTAGIGNAVGNVGTAVQGAMGGQGSWLNVAKVAGAHALGGAAANVLSGGSFSWRSVAANAVGSVASAATTNAVFGTVPLPGGSGSILSDTATSLVGGIVSAHTRKAFGVGGVNEGRIALDAFGNAVANAMVRSAEDRLRLREAAEVEAQMRRSRAGIAIGQWEDGSFIDANGTRFGIGVGMTDRQRSMANGGAETFALGSDAERASMAALPLIESPRPGELGTVTIGPLRTVRLDDAPPLLAARTTTSLAGMGGAGGTMTVANDGRLTDLNKAVLRFYSGEGDRDRYWSYLCGLGDAYACLALGVVRNDTLAGYTANEFAKRRAADLGVYLDERAWNQFGVDLMKRDFAYRERKGLVNLPVRNISDYHAEAFKDIGLDANAWTAHVPLSRFLAAGDDAGAERVWQDMLSDSHFRRVFSVSLRNVPEMLDGDWGDPYSQWQGRVSEIALGFSRDQAFVNPNTIGLWNYNERSGEWLMQNPPRTAPHAGLQAGLAAPIHPDPTTAVRLNADRAFRLERMKPTARHPLDMTPPQRSR